MRSVRQQKKVVVLPSSQIFFILGSVGFATQHFFIFLPNPWITLYWNGALTMLYTIFYENPVGSGCKDFCERGLSDSLQTFIPACICVISEITKTTQGDRVGFKGLYSQKRTNFNLKVKATILLTVWSIVIALHMLHFCLGAPPTRARQ